MPFTVYTVTFNPALDYLMYTSGVNMGETNRSNKETLQFGGKGINVSAVLASLGVKTVALGFVGGFTGKMLEKEVKKQGIKTDFIYLKKGNTRINVKIKDTPETEINAKGPEISPDDISKLFKKLKRIKKGDTLVLSGSVPKGVSLNIYKEIFERLSKKKINIVVDAAGELLLNTLPLNPFLIKPNKGELEELVGAKLKTLDDIKNAAEQLKQKGAKNVLVSLGSDGALLLDQNGNYYYHKAPKITPINTVAAGDSAVAGFIAGFDNGFEYALKLAVASGSATAAKEGIATKKEIISLI